MTTKKLLIILLLSLAGIMSKNIIAQSLTLQNCLTTALENNNKIKNAKLDVQSYNYSKNEAISAGLPQIIASGNLKYNIDNATMLLPGDIMGKPGETIAVQTGTKYYADGNISINQLVYSGSYLLGVKAAKTGLRLSNLAVEKTEEEVIYNVSASYFNLLQLNEQMKALQSNLDMIKKLTEISELQFQNDIIKKVELDRINVTKTNLETQVDNLNAGIVQLTNVLKYYMGIPVTKEISIDFNQQINVPENLSLLDLNIQHEQRSDIKILNTQKEISELQLRGAKAAFQPTLLAFGQFSYQAMRNDFNFTDTNKDWFKMNMVGLKLNVPIFTGFGNKSKVNKAKIALKQSQINIDEVTNLVSMEFENAKNKLTNSLKSVKAQSKNKQLAEDVYTQTQLGYKEGTTPLISLLDAENALREAKTGYNNQVLNYKIAELDLLKAKGNLKNLLKK